MTAAAKTFNPCRGKMFCRDNGEMCTSCGRSNEEIAHTRALMEAMTEVTLRLGYDNAEEFLTYLRDKALRQVEFARGDAGFMQQFFASKR